MRSFRLKPQKTSSTGRSSRAAEWIAVLYIGLVIATPLLIFEGPRVLPAFEQVSIAQLVMSAPAAKPN